MIMTSHLHIISNNAEVEERLGLFIMLSTRASWPYNHLLSKPNETQNYILTAFLFEL